MAEEVYKILQSRLRKQAQHDSTCNNQYDCEGCRQSKHQAEECTKKKRPSTSGEDPLSHKIIEKRRRDRMNSCLADLSHLIPSNYLKKGRGRIEKTEIVEMAIKHIKHLHELLPSSVSSSSAQQQSSNNDQDESSSRMGSNWKCPQEVESFKNGFNECMAEAVHCLVEKEHIPPENPLCSRLVTHLKRHLEFKDHSAAKKEDQTAQSAGDSDYSSIRSESSAANSEVGSVVSSVQSNSGSSISQGLKHHHHHQRMTNSGSRPSSYVIAEGKRRSSDEIPSGKFKFKDSIRERFSHEFESQSGLGENEDHLHEEFQAKRRKSSSRASEQENKHYVSQSFNASKIHPSSSTETAETKKSVPIFALHPKGSHYIPLSISDDVIQPYVHLFEQGTEMPLMLHPITISVNFCGPIRIAAEVRNNSQHRQNLPEPESSLVIKEDRSEN